MSISTQNTSLSLSARLLLYLGPPSVVALTAFASPKVGLLSPLAFLPTAWLFRKWQASNQTDPARRADLESLIWVYASTGTFGLAAMSVIQGVGMYALCTLLFGNGGDRNFFIKEFMRSNVEGLSASELADRAQLAHSWKNWILNGVFFFSVVGFVEEVLKYMPIAYARRRRQKEDQARRQKVKIKFPPGAYIDYALAGALSFGVIEGIGFLFAAREETGSKLLLTIFERLIVGSSGHLLMAALTALRATRRDFYNDQMSWLSVVGPSALLHGAFDFAALSFSASDGNVGWIHPTSVKKTAAMLTMAAGFLVAQIALVRREWSILHDRKDG